MNEHVWTLILAGGRSSRFGGIKALAPWKEETLLSNALRIANEFSGGNSIVVTGAYQEDVNAALKGDLSVHNNGWQDGMGSSISCGLEKILSLDAKTDTVLILCIDQPLVDSDHLKALLQKSRETGLCVLSTDGRIDSPPAIAPSAYFDVLKNLKRDAGLKKFLGKYERIENAKALLDIDTPQDLALLTRSIPSAA